MASTSQSDAVAGASSPGAQHEMSTLQSTAQPETPLSPNQIFEDAVQQQPIAPSTAPTTEAPTQLPAIASIAQPPNPEHHQPSTPPALSRTETEPLGPATEETIAPPTTAGPVLSISLMLTTGARHPYKIDEKYLKNRKVEARNAAGEFEPRELSGYQLKELIWTDWRSEWEPRPTSPSSIRLIVMGRMIEDKGYLKDFPFNLATTNVVHMTVKPADLIDDDDAAAAKGTKGGVARARDDGEGGAGCRCVIL